MLKQAVAVVLCASFLAGCLELALFLWFHPDNRWARLPPVRCVKTPAAP